VIGKIEILCMQFMNNWNELCAMRLLNLLEKKIGEDYLIRGGLLTFGFISILAENTQNRSCIIIDLLFLADLIVIFVIIVIFLLVFSLISLLIFCEILLSDA